MCVKIFYNLGKKIESYIVNQLSQLMTLSPFISFLDQGLCLKTTSMSEQGKSPFTFHVQLFVQFTVKVSTKLISDPMRDFKEGFQLIVLVRVASQRSHRDCQARS